MLCKNHLLGGHVFVLQEIEKLSVTTWNGGGSYKIKNFTDSSVHGKYCTAYSPSRYESINWDSVFVAE